MESVRVKAQEQVLQLFGDEISVEMPPPLLPKEKSLFQEKRDIIVLEAPIVEIITLISLSIGHFEGWSVIYYGVMTALTVGYGDVSPQSEEMRVVAIIFTPIAVTVFCEVLGRIAGAYMTCQTITAEKAFLRRRLTMEDYGAHGRKQGWTGFLVSSRKTTFGFRQH
jgi:Ion channel